MTLQQLTAYRFCLPLFAGADQSTLHKKWEVSMKLVSNYSIQKNAMAVFPGPHSSRDRQVSACVMSVGQLRLLPLSQTRRTGREYTR
jgi:hypothetical protein